MAEPRAKITKAGSVDITPVGHTQSGKFGVSTTAKVRGRSTTPSPITFGG